MAAYNKGNIFYLGEFDEVMEENIGVSLVTELQKQCDKADGRLDFYINSYGGVLEVVEHVLGIIDVAKAQNLTVRTMITGAAYSGGSIVAVAGSPGHRYMHPHAMHLVHYGSSETRSTNPVDAERNHLVNKRFFNFVKSHYRKHTEIPDDILAAGMQSDMWHITYAEAKRWRMFDSPLDRLNPLG